MKRVIGIVCEGPTDYLALAELVDYITGEENEYKSIQPEPDMCGENGNGWHGVYRWCKKTNNVEEIMNSIFPRIDWIIVQMDADVARKEKAVHCHCQATNCKVISNQVWPIECVELKHNNCKIQLPCLMHKHGTEGFTTHIQKELENVIGCNNSNRIIVTVPCDSTDAWIVAAYDNYTEVDTIEDPWNSIIAKTKEYHGTRIRGNKKSQVTYRQLVEGVDDWGIVFEKSTSARKFRETLTEMMMEK